AAGAVTTRYAPDGAVAAANHLAAAAGVLTLGRGGNAADAAIATAAVMAGVAAPLCGVRRGAFFAPAPARPRPPRPPSPPRGEPAQAPMQPRYGGRGSGGCPSSATCGA